MRTIQALDALRQTISRINKDSASVGFVPTMGALHKGHLELVKRSLEENDLTFVSIFVNPIQFNNPQDLEQYPRVLGEDTKMLEDLGVDYLFTPNEKEFYESPPLVSINFGVLAERLEGKYRKGHFEGVGVVVSKFFNLINPDRAYFGLKDLQQFLLVKRMSQDLSYRCDIIGVATVREESGLALSSRNRRLTKQGLTIATILSKVLYQIKHDLENAVSFSSLLDKAHKLCANQAGFELEYLELVRPSDLSSVSDYSDLNELAICIAGYVEGVRLIDNLYLRLNTEGNVNRGIKIEDSQG